MFFTYKVDTRDKQIEIRCNDWKSWIVHQLSEYLLLVRQKKRLDLRTHVSEYFPRQYPARKRTVKIILGGPYWSKFAPCASSYYSLRELDRLSIKSKSSRDREEFPKSPFSISLSNIRPTVRVCVSLFVSMWVCVGLCEFVCVWVYLYLSVCISEFYCLCLSRDFPDNREKLYILRKYVFPVYVFGTPLSLTHRLRHTNSPLNLILYSSGSPFRYHIAGNAV